MCRHKMRKKLLLIFMKYVILSLLFPQSALTQDSRRMDASDSFSLQQGYAYGSGWVINSVANDTFHSMAVDNIEMRNIIERNLNQTGLSKDQGDIDLKGPKAGAGSEIEKTTGLNIVKDGKIDQHDYDMIEKILRGEIQDPNYTSEDLISDLLDDFEAAGLFDENKTSGERTQMDKYYDWGLGGYSYAGGQDDYNTLLGFSEFTQERQDEVISKILRAIEVSITGSTWLGNAPLDNAGRIFTLGRFDITGDTLEKTTYTTIYHGYTPTLKDINLSTGFMEGFSGDTKDATRDIYPDLKSTSVYTPTAETRFLQNTDIFTDSEEGKNTAEYLIHGSILPDNFDISTLEEQPLEDILTYLENKENKTEFDEALFKVAQALMIDKGYMDEASKNGFEEAIHLIYIAAAIQELLPDADFGAITNVFDNFTIRHESSYNNYLISTEKIYQELEKILGIDLESAILPNKYKRLNTLGPKTKRKILVDLTLKHLSDKNKENLSNSEKKALSIYQNTLLVLTRKYRDTLKKSVDKLILSLNKALANVKPASLAEDKEQFKILFSLGR